MDCPRVSRPLARLPVRFQLKDTVTLDRATDFSRTVVSGGYLLSRETLTCLRSTGSKKGVVKEKKRREKGYKMWTAKCSCKRLLRKANRSVSGPKTAAMSRGRPEAQWSK